MMKQRPGPIWKTYGCVDRRELQVSIGPTCELRDALLPMGGGLTKAGTVRALQALIQALVPLVRQARFTGLTGRDTSGTFNQGANTAR